MRDTKTIGIKPELYAQLRRMMQEGGYVNFSDMLRDIVRQKTAATVDDVEKRRPGRDSVAGRSFMESFTSTLKSCGPSMMPNAVINA